MVEVQLTFSLDYIEKELLPIFKMLPADEEIRISTPILIQLQAAMQRLEDEARIAESANNNPT